MIRYNEFLYFVGNIIKEHFKNCTLVSKKNQEDINGPMFYVEVIPVSSNSYKYYIDRVVNLTITYTDKVVDNEKLNNVLNELESIFDLGIKINDTFFIFKSKDSRIEDGFLTFNLTINYKDNKDVIDENDVYSAMLEELYLDL